MNTHEGKRIKEKLCVGGEGDRQTDREIWTIAFTI